MQIIPLSEFRRLTGKEAVQSVSPCAISFDGQIVGYFCNIEDVLFLGDMHPRVRRQFRAQEAKVRMGMPTPKRVDVSELIPTTI